MKHRNKLETKRSGLTLILFIIVFVIFVFYAFTIIYPIAWGLISSLKTPGDFYDNTFGLPAEYRWDNYLYAWTNLEYSNVTLAEMFWNSIWFSVGSIVINVFFTALVGYIVSKYQFRGRTLIYNVVVFSMIIPIYGSFPSVYKTYHMLGFVDSYLILLSATGVLGMNFILMVSYFKNISWTYAEAAMMDGAGHFTIFSKIMLPLVKPMLVSLFLVGFIGKWNDYMSALLYLPNKLTLAAGLYRYQEVALRMGQAPTLFAGLFIALLPILLVFFAFSNTMMNNMTFGGIKG